MDSQQALTAGSDGTPRSVAIIVIGAVVALVFLKKLSVSVSTS